MKNMDKKKPEFGLLIDYEYCTGCHACELACAQEYTHKVGIRGIKVFEVEQTRPDGSEYLTYFPFPTETCLLCPHLTREGFEPACVKHCMAACMKYGRIEDLAKEIGAKPRMVLWVPR
jgi:Fe-S-cluster-containing dehydrogenase component